MKSTAEVNPRCALIYTFATLTYLPICWMKKKHTLISPTVASTNILKIISTVWIQSDYYVWLFTIIYWVCRSTTYYCQTICYFSYIYTEKYKRSILYDPTRSRTFILACIKYWIITYASFMCVAPTAHNRFLLSPCILQSVWCIPNHQHGALNYCSQLDFATAARLSCELIERRVLIGMLLWKKKYIYIKMR